jgi:AcrR family transcriptional regulator
VPTPVKSNASTTKARARRPNDGDQTRSDLLDVAETLFATHGPEGVSIRSVNAAAGLAPAAVHYHFGSKDALVRAVLNRRGAAVTRRHVELLEQIERRRRRPTGRELVEALATPLIELIQRDPVGGLRWIKVSARLNQSRSPILLRFTGRPSGENERFQRLVCRAYPKVPEDVALIRWKIAGNAFLRLLADADSPSAHVAGEDPTTLSEEFIAALVDFTVAGVEGLADSSAAAKGAKASPGRRQRPASSDS